MAEGIESSERDVMVDDEGSAQAAVATVEEVGGAVERTGGTTSGWDSRTEALLEDWRRRATAARAAHYTLASRMRRRNLFIGVPSVVFSSVVGTSLFATLSTEDVNKTLRIIIGLVSFAAAVLAALQTFFRFNERAERHVVAADWYSAIRRDLAQLIALSPGQRGEPKECLDRVRKEMNKIGQQAPEISDQLWTKVAQKYSVDDSP